MNKHRALPVDAALLHALEVATPGGVSGRAIDRLAMAHDASHYLLTPRAVLTPAGIDQVGALVKAATRLSVPLTFRSGGTSLSGQATTDQLLVDTRRHFRKVTVLDGGRRVVAQPGATVRQVNTRLVQYGRKLGPDPASEAACTIGGVIANNSSGMACGTEYNSYQTLESAVLLLASGTVIDTAAAHCDQELKYREPELHEGLLRLRDRIRADPSSVATIRQQFSRKNTMGYGLNSFLDHDDPIDLLLHLVVGSEGTLAFVAEATFHTIPIRPCTATGLLVFPDLRDATDALPELVASGFATIELLDATSLRVVQTDPSAIGVLRHLAVERHAALLVEYQESSDDLLQARLVGGAPILAGLPLSMPAQLVGDAHVRAALWHVRKGIYAAVAGNRPSGTTALLEDVAVPVESLADTCEQLVQLFERHDYEASVIFGHAKDGNIHFMLNERFDDPASLARYLAFTRDMVDLVLGHGGTLKAEHGTGRIMAPFVRRQYGDELYGVMVELKRLCDPAGILNPGAILTKDPLAHVAHLKTTPVVEAEVDRCVECGYCEPVCPSQDLTLTPRQRIVLRRELVRAQAAGDKALAREIAIDYQYDGIDTCAADGMCQTACPVLIDTGELVKRLRAEQHMPVRDNLWKRAAQHWRPVTRSAAAVLTVARRLPPAVTTTVTAVARKAFGVETFPQWSNDLPRGGRRREVMLDANAEIVYFASCIGSMFGGAAESGDVGSAFVELNRRAGVRLTTPTEINALCCGTPWKSKGFREGYDAMAARTVHALSQASGHGTLPIVCDASSCSEALQQLVDSELGGKTSMRVIDSISFTAKHLLPKLTVTNKLPSLTLHPTCSSTRLGIHDVLIEMAEAIAHIVQLPADWGCCAFAGDRGLLHPELTASATSREAAQVEIVPTSHHASTNRTCEIGMTRATGQAYRHLVELVEQVTR